MTYIYLNKATMEAKFRMALTGLQRAYDEIAYLHEGGFGEQMQTVLADLGRVIAGFTDERDQAAERYGFTPKPGTGPGDWKHSPDG